ncbi:MAG: hypothetical protein V4474_00910 [Patescibacteria group bacterium]
MDVTTLVNNVTRVLINPAILLIFGIALVVFIWGLVQFLWAANVGGKESNTGKQHMLWGVVGMFIMVASFGILTLIQNTVNSLH